MPTHASVSTWLNLAAAGCLAVTLSACDSKDSKPTGEDTSSSSSSSSGSSGSSSSSSSSGMGTANQCSGSEAAFCGDFDDWATEEGSALPPSWSINASTGTTVTVSSEQSYSGDKSIKVVSAGGGYNRGFLTLDLTQTPPLQNEMYGSTMIYVSDENANGGDFTFLQAEGSTPQPGLGIPENTHVMYRGRIDQSYDHVFTHYDTLLDNNADTQSEWVTNCSKHPSFTETMAPPSDYILPKNEWVCIQWHIKQSSNHIDLTVNGNSLTAIRVYDTGDTCENSESQGGMWYAPEQFERLHVGVAQYAEEALPRTMYIDDVVVHSSRVNCDGSIAESSSH